MKGPKNQSNFWCELTAVELRTIGTLIQFYYLFVACNSNVFFCRIIILEKSIKSSKRVIKKLNTRYNEKSKTRCSLRPIKKLEPHISKANTYASLQNTFFNLNCNNTDKPI